MDPITVVMVVFAGLMVGKNPRAGCAGILGVAFILCAISVIFGIKIV